MANFTSILSDVGKGLKKFFSVVLGAAQVAEPIIDVAFPGLAVLYNATVNEAVKAEAAAIAAGQQNGTGAQKLALVIEAVTPQVVAFAAQNGLPAPTAATITNYVNAVVATLNAIPSAPTA